MTQQTYSETISGKIRKFPRGQINRFAANNEYTRNNHRILLYMEKISKLRHFPTFLRPESECLRFCIKIYAYLQEFYVEKPSK